MTQEEACLRIEFLEHETGPAFQSDGGVQGKFDGHFPVIRIKQKKKAPVLRTRRRAVDVADHGGTENRFDPP